MESSRCQTAEELQIFLQFRCCWPQTAASFPEYTAFANIKPAANSMSRSIAAVRETRLKHGFEAVWDLNELIYSDAEMSFNHHPTKMPYKCVSLVSKYALGGCVINLRKRGQNPQVFLLEIEHRGHG